MTPHTLYSRFPIVVVAFCVLVPLQLSLASKYNPQVKVRKVDVSHTLEKSPTGKDGANQGINPNPNKLNCENARCMPQPIVEAGAPACKPRYEDDSCCPKWICASDHMLMNSLFDKDDNWIPHETIYDDEEHEEGDGHSKWKAEGSHGSKKLNPNDPKFKKYAESGKLDNSHNQNFLNRFKKENKKEGKAGSKGNRGKSKSRSGKSKGKGKVQVRVQETDTVNDFEY